MQITITVDDTKWAWAVQACAPDKSNPLDKATQMVVEYLDACGQQLGISPKAQLAAAVAALDDAGTATLLPQAQALVPPKAVAATT